MLESPYPYRHVVGVFYDLSATRSRRRVHTTRSSRSSTFGTKVTGRDHSFRSPASFCVLADTAHCLLLLRIRTFYANRAEKHDASTRCWRVGLLPSSLPFRTCGHALLQACPFSFRKRNILFCRAASSMPSPALDFPSLAFTSGAAGRPTSSP